MAALAIALAGFGLIVVAMTAYVVIAVSGGDPVSEDFDRGAQP